MLQVAPVEMLASVLTRAASRRRVYILVLVHVMALLVLVVLRAAPIFVLRGVVLQPTAPQIFWLGHVSFFQN